MTKRKQTGTIERKRFELKEKRLEFEEKGFEIDLNLKKDSSSKTIDSDSFQENRFRKIDSEGLEKESEWFFHADVGQ